MARVDPAILWQSNDVEGTVSASSSHNVQKRGAISVGDVLILAISSSTQSSAATVNWAGTGWTPLIPTAGWSSASYGRVSRVFYKVADSTDAAKVTGTDTWAFSFTGTTGRVTYKMLNYGTSIDPTTIRIAQASYGSASDLNTNSPFWIQSPALTGLTVGETLLHFEWNNAISTSPIEPTGPTSTWTYVGKSKATASTGVSTTVSYAQAKVATATTEAAARVQWGTTAGGVSAGAHAHVIAFQGPVIVDLDGLPILLRGVSSTLPGHVQVWRSGAPVTPTALQIVPRGFASVAEAFATPGFTSLHRGLRPHAEMSDASYSMGAIAGWPMFEASLSESSDHVLFLAHDDGPTNTTGGVFTGLWTDYTWEQIQAMVNTDGIEDRSFMLFDTLAERYGDTHTIMVDPKELWNVRTSTEKNALLDLIIDRIGLDRTLFKYYGNQMGDFLTKVHAKGGLAWGYFFKNQGHLSSGSWTTWSTAGWDSIGVEWSANSTEQAQVLAVGVPVIAHEADSQSNYDTAIAWGADGVQCRRSDLIAPVRGSI